MMVSPKNIQTVKEVSGQLRKYPVIGILDMFKLPASQLHQIRRMLKGKAVIRMVKKRLIILALKESGLKGSDALSDVLRGEPALIMTDMNPFKLARLVDENKSEAPAKEGDIAPRDILINAGPTPLAPGPVIGDLQKAKIPAMIEGDKIHVRQDTVVAKEGDEIDSLLAGVLAKLGITPMHVGLDLVAACEDGTVYGKDILFIPREKYLDDMISAHQGAFNLAYNLGFPTRETVPFLLSRAHMEAHSLALAAGILTADTVVPLLAKANAQMQALKEKAPLSASVEAENEPPVEASQEEEPKPDDESGGMKPAGGEKKKEGKELPEEKKDG
jgi:large subunit ribosomal protein L10